jgi:hypothetical protein
MATSIGYRRVLAASVLLAASLALTGSSVAATAKPSIHNFLPRSGVAGTTVTITGKNFTAATEVKIDGLKAAYTVRSATRITATVPGTAKTGKVSVITKAGTATSMGTIAIYAPNGSGTLTTATTTVGSGSTGNTIAFTYTAATGGTSNGSITIAVPVGWSAPVTTSAAGCTSATVGTVSTSGQTITVSGLTLPAKAATVVSYGATSGGACVAGDGATASASGGSATWQAQQKSLSTGTLTNLAASPSISLYAPNGSGTVTPTALGVPVGSNNDVITLTYTAAAGGMNNGTVTVLVPAGWSAPTTSNTLGCTTASSGTVTASSQTITVSGLTLAGGATVVITYGAVSGGSCTSNDGATAPSTGGALTFTMQQASTATGTLTALASSPVVTAS